jgi:hypothetical protein
MYYLDDGLGRKRPLLIVVAVVVIAWGFMLFNRTKTSPFVSPWRNETEALKGNAPPLVAVMVAQKGGLSVVGRPSIGPERIDEVLSSYGSPATGSGKAMYDLGVSYGIDPAFCLAFFIHESTAGTRGVASVTKSVGNIRTTTGYRDYQGYRKYDTWEEGIEDWYRLIKDLYIDGWKLTTVEQILPVYAPPQDDNDTGAYISSVVQLVESWRREGRR